MKSAIENRNIAQKAKLEGLLASIDAQARRGFFNLRIFSTSCGVPANGYTGKPLVQDKSLVLRRRGSDHDVVEENKAYLQSLGYKVEVLPPIKRGTVTEEEKVELEKFFNLEYVLNISWE